MGWKLASFGSNPKAPVPGQICAKCRIDKWAQMWYYICEVKDMSYVRVDQVDKYIYFLNDIIFDNGRERSRYLLRDKRLPCIRMKKISDLPLDKKVNVWYHKYRKE